MAQTTRHNPVASSEQMLDWDTQNRPANTPEDAPPTYTRTPSSPRPKDKDAASNTTSHSSPTSVRGHIRLCPHETLFFPRYQLITNLPNIQQTPHLPLLSKLSTPNHNTHHHTHGRTCSITHTLPSHPLHTTSHVLLRPSPSSALFLLHTKHQLHFPSPLKTISRTDIHQTLSHSPIKLCPHKNLSNTWIVAAISRLHDHTIKHFNNLSTAEQQEEEGSNVTALSCEDCDTRVYVKKWKGNEEGGRIEVDRVLGRGEGAWWELCEGVGVREGMGG